MKLTKFLSASLISGAVKNGIEIQSWIDRNQETANLSYLAKLIILSLHYESEPGGVGPAQMAHNFGYSRSRVSQEVTQLSKMGLVVRSLSKENARSVTLELSANGKKQAIEIVKSFSKLQRIIDAVLGEKEAEQIAMKLNRLSQALQGNK